MELTSGVIATCALLALWALEALIPGLYGRGAGAGRRVRNMLLGLLNAGASAVVVLVLLGAAIWSDAHGVGLLRVLEVPGWLSVLAALVVLDFWQYATHVLMHKAPLLWRVHTVHHHADRLEATVAMRFHTLEVVATGLSLLPLIVVLGIGIEEIALYNLLLLPLSMFHHANIALSPALDRALRWVIVTPGMHCVHHSRWQPETDSNYSAVLSVWDRLFGTMRTLAHPERLRVGLDGFRDEEIHTVGGMLATPFSDSRAGLGTPAGGDEAVKREPEPRSHGAMERV